VEAPINIKVFRIGAERIDKGVKNVYSRFARGDRNLILKGEGTPRNWKVTSSE
jgi:hypothetical protein